MRSHSEAISDHPGVEAHSRWHDLVLLTKPRLSSLVLFTTLTGFVLAQGGWLDWALLLDTLIGTALVAFGSSALNQALEIRCDGLMRRTMNRPLPAGRMTVAQAVTFGVVSSLLGLAYLSGRVNNAAALWALVTLLVYVLAYTPLKRISSLNTIVGAVSGALPPIIGWAAARGELNLQACSLFSILFLWQLPHFLAIAWMYREDYARAGFRMLPHGDSGGLSTGRQAVIQSVMLWPVTLTPYFLGLTGPVYFALAFCLGLVFIASGMSFAMERTELRARRLFLASVVYLPLLLAGMLLDRA